MLFLIDLDGPLLDVSEKYYRVYADLLRERSVVPLEKDVYWQSKRAKIPERKLLEMTGAAHFYEEYASARVSRIETDDYLKFDELQPAVADCLASLSRMGELVLVTLRNSNVQARAQLRKFGLETFFSAVLSSGQELEPRWRVKEKLVLDRFGDKLSQPAVFVGDTETDINAGKALGCATVAVECGIRTRELLSATNPDFLLPRLESLVDVLPTVKARASSYRAQPTSP